MPEGAVQTEAQDAMVVEVKGASRPPAGAKAMPAGKGEEPTQALVLFAVVFYATCSSTMLVLNKLAVHHMQAPSFVMFCQMVTTAGAVYGASKVGWVEADAFEWGKMKAFFWVVATFAAMVITNMKILQYANVETFIVFRSSTPLLVAFMDYAFLGRCLPSARSCAALLFILLGASQYMRVDSHFEVRSYGWAATWYALFVFDVIYIKHVCNTVEMTTWGRSLYQNAMTVPFCCVFFVFFGEYEVMKTVQWSVPQLAFLFLSCLVGIGMSYAGFLLRQTVSATSFTVVGIVCKIATVMINLMIWDKHASTAGLAALALCLGAGTVYQQSPMRSTHSPKN